MKTAVEWLVNMLYSPACNGFLNGQRRDIPSHIVEQAKEKEKEQIIKSHIDGFDYIVAEFKKQEYAEEYFNKTYKNQTP